MLQLIRIHSGDLQSPDDTHLIGDCKTARKNNTNFQEWNKGLNETNSKQSQTWPRYDRMVTSSHENGLGTLHLLHDANCFTLESGKNLLDLLFNVALGKS